MQYKGKISNPQDLVNKRYCDENTSGWKLQPREFLSILKQTNVSNYVENYGLAKFRLTVPEGANTISEADYDKLESVANCQVNLLFNIGFRALFDDGSSQNYNTQGAQTFSTNIMGTGRATYFSGQSISPAGELSISGYTRVNRTPFVEGILSMLVYLKPKGLISDMSIPSQQELRFVITADMIKAGKEVEIVVPNRTNLDLPKSVFIKVNSVMMTVNARSEASVGK